ncbi:DNA helicase [Escherichia coli]|nr:DNA helicase [Escherichia coli]
MESLPNIIDYCNSLFYHGKLQPKRGMEKGRFSPQWDIYILMVEA